MPGKLAFKKAHHVVLEGAKFKKEKYVDLDETQGHEAPFLIVIHLHYHTIINIYLYIPF